MECARVCLCGVELLILGNYDEIHWLENETFFTYYNLVEFPNLKCVTLATTNMWSHVQVHYVVFQLLIVFGAFELYSCLDKGNSRIGDHSLSTREAFML